MQAFNEWVQSPTTLPSLLSLTLLELVLGIDNIVFISILANKVPQSTRTLTWNIGLFSATAVRLLLLASLSILLGLSEPIAHLFGRSLSVKDFILIAGGLFLIYKAVVELHDKLEGANHSHVAHVPTSMFMIIVQLSIINAVFSIDSVLTAIGMTRDVAVMVFAIIASTVLMLVFARTIGNFVERHPTVKVLALTFLILIGVNLIAEGSHFDIPKGYTYFAMTFAVLVETLNLRLRKGKAVELHEAKLEELSGK